MAAKTPLATLSFLLLLAFAVGQASWQLHGECDFARINTQNPTYRLQSEGGESEFFDHNSKEFRCAGVSIHRHTIRSRGLMLPAYHNAPILVYVIQGRGVFGTMLSGCPETFESSPQVAGSRSQSQRFSDRHQKIGELRQGDVIAIPAGAPHWAYNNGDQDLVVVVLQDNKNNANQLDSNPRTFFLAGSPRQQEQQQRHYMSRRGETKHEFGNVFQGFDVQTLAEVFGVDEETARKLQSQNDDRGFIITVERELQFLRPPLSGEEFSGREEEQYGRRGPFNGIEETICTAKIKENIDRPSRADIYNPRAGRFSTVNSFTLPILRFFQLSAARGILYKNGIMSPHWYVNAHSIMHVTRGRARIQVVNQNGEAVLDDEVQEGQVVVVPQNFAVVKEAGEEGFEWVEFNTNDNAMINTLSGRTSAFRGLPAAVIANSYQISREAAEKLKFSRQETLLFQGRKSSRRQ